MTVHVFDMHKKTSKIENRWKTMNTFLLLINFCDKNFTNEEEANLTYNAMPVKKSNKKKTCY